ncbi:MAG TPA: hypothetical protein VLT33_26935 [Labilithrix sp.]|nr:hypothetical protein [Labilithrix sp.]
MSYAEDLATLVRLEKLRLIALIFAMTCSLGSIAFDIDWLLWPRAFGWAAAAVIAGLEARAEKRLGRDPDGSWLRAGLFAVAAALFFVFAARA